MGNSLPLGENEHDRLNGVCQRAEGRAGKLSVTGRYHRLPKKLEDDYKLDASKILGTGYSGSVFMAYSKHGNKKYAVKAFKIQGIGQDKKEELETECEIFLAMDHPHVARLTDVYESDERLDLVMECMEGGELFQRVSKLKRFSENNAQDAAYQMLLAVNYIHKHDIVHRDIKLENFLYESDKSNHLKLIDFGFSKVWDPSTQMKLACGTLAYVSPEVLSKNYTSQCDMWSLGVVVFILLVGYMPFGGSQDHQIEAIKSGRYVIRKEAWNRCSREANDFVSQLLKVEPDKRLTAEQALQHEWIASREASAHRPDHINEQTAQALVNFGQASNFRRACLSVMSWSLTNDERAQVRQAFLELDTEHRGTVTLHEFKTVLHDKFHMQDEELEKAFHALDTSHTDEIHYSDFLAAMMKERIKLHDDLLIQTFNRFDTDNTGYITAKNLKEVLGEHYEGQEMDNLLAEADVDHNDKIDLKEFMRYLTGEDVSQAHHEAALKIVDNAHKDASYTGGRSPGLKLKADKASDSKPEKQQPKCCTIS